MDLGKTTITSGPRKHVHAAWFMRNFGGIIVSHAIKYTMDDEAQKKR